MPTPNHPRSGYWPTIVGGLGWSYRPPQASHHSQCKSLSLAFSVAPKHVMTEFVVNGLHPHPFAAIDPAPFPVFRMYEMDSTVLERFSGGSTPIYVFEPLNMRLFDPIKAAKVRNSTLEHRLTMVSK